MSSLHLVTRATAEQFSEKAASLLNVWIYFNLVVNTIFLPILVATFLLSKRAKRHPTLVNVCMVWIFSGIFSLLLFYAGQHDPKSPEPDKSLCIAQTSLLYGIIPMWSVAVLMLVLHLNLSFAGYKDKDRSLWTLISMLAAPYVVLLIFFISALAISQAQPDRVDRNSRVFYCTLHNTPLFNGMVIATTLICFAVTCLEVRLGMTLYRNWRAIRSARLTNGNETALLLRVLLFGGYVFVGMIVNLYTAIDSTSVFPDIFAATIGTVVFLIFGTQSDVLRVWRFWLSHKPAPIYLSGEPNWRHSIDLLKSATPGDLEKGGFHGAKLIEIKLTPPPPAAFKS